MSENSQTENLQEKIKKSLDQVRPHLQMDGGDAEFVSFDEKTGVLKVKMQGACHGCPMAHMTLSEGIGRQIKAQVPEVKAVEAI